MRIRIKKAESTAWYDTLIGSEFEAWKNPMKPGIYFVNTMLFVLGEDCEVINGKEEELQTFN